MSTSRWQSHIDGCLTSSCRALANDRSFFFNVNWLCQCFFLSHVALRFVRSENVQKCMIIEHSKNSNLRNGYLIVLFSTFTLPSFVYCTFLHATTDHRYLYIHACICMYRWWASHLPMSKTKVHCSTAQK